MKQAVAFILCALLVAPNSLIVTARPVPVQAAKELIRKSYLDLLELDEIQRFPTNEIKDVEDDLKKERGLEQARLKKEEDRIEQELKITRKRLDELNKKASRDDVDAKRQRAEIHCEVLRLEAELAKTETEREKGVPIVYQNKFAKLDLIQRWPQIRSEIEEKIEAGQARERRYGNVEDIGVRDLGIENLAEKQQQDIKMGQEAIREMRTQALMPPEAEDKELGRYVEKLARTIASNSDLKVPIKVTVLDSMEINAFALPGGFLFVNTGLINKAETESELVGVLAHETAHAAARHGARLTKRSTIAGILLQAAEIGAVVLTGGGAGAYYALQYGFYGLGMALNLSLLGVSRDYEAEADQLGAQYAWQAGYDPKGFITFFDKMANEEGYVKSASFFRTHPPFLERIISTFSEITYLPQRDDLLMDSSAFSEAKKRVAESIKQREQEGKDKPTLRGESPECRLPNGKPISN